MNIEIPIKVSDTLTQGPTMDKSLDPQSAKAPKEPKTLYMLWHRSGSNPHSALKMFYHGGTIQQVVASAKHYCDKTNSRFVQVHPAIIDFDEELRKIGVND